jgi:Glycosyl hydrolases family 2, TIM barrel domain/Glycosyl hydrolases family 2/Glycosyl hydrolases family 2, sugar binding domain
MIAAPTSGAGLRDPAVPAAPGAQEGPGGQRALVDWTRAEDPKDTGAAEGRQTGAFAGTATTVPNTANPAPVKGPAAIASYEGSTAWYRTTFTAATAGTYAVSFESVSETAEVWIDGEAAGTHTGFDLPFEVQRALTAGTHTIVVHVDWRDPVAQTHEGFHKTMFNFGGIPGKVYVRQLGASELADPTVQTALEPDSPKAKTATVTVRVSVEVRNNSTARTIAPEGRLSRAGETIPVRFAAQAVGAGESVRMSATATVPRPALWEPGRPNLYELEIAVPSESGYRTHVGLRELTWAAGKMYLNGRRLTLKGASFQMEAAGRGEALGPAEEDAIVRELRAIGANAARSQHPLPASMLERLDAAGIMVWQGVGPNDPSGDWTGRTKALEERALGDVQTAAEAEQTHPCVIAWNLTNEMAGSGREDGQVQYIQAAAAWLHAYDQGRMVAVDVWGEHPPKTAGPVFANVDAVSETDYSGWYEDVHDSAKRLKRLIRERDRAMNRTFAGKVQIISEFGAEANALGRPKRPGGYAFQSKLLAEHITAYAADPHLSGMLVWVLRDFAETPTYDGGSIRRELPRMSLIEGINGKGLFDYHGRPKPAAAVVAKLFRALPAV